MLVYRCEDGFTGYNRLVPLLGFAYLERIPLVDLREATRPARVAAVCISAAMAALGCVGWFALDARLAYRRPLGVAAGTLVFLLSSMSWGRPRPQQLAHTRRCQVRGIAPAVLLAEWFLTFASAWAMTRLDLAPVSSLALVEIFNRAADWVLIPLALLPFANALWFRLAQRKQAPKLRLTTRD
jgi:hypothetical protein